MLSWIAIIIAAFALAEILQIYLRDRSKREFKQRHITRRLKQIEQRERAEKDSKTEES